MHIQSGQWAAKSSNFSVPSPFLRAPTVELVGNATGNPPPEAVGERNPSPGGAPTDAPKVQKGRKAPRPAYCKSPGSPAPSPGKHGSFSYADDGQGVKDGSVASKVASPTSRPASSFLRPNDSPPGGPSEVLNSRGGDREVPASAPHNPSSDTQGGKSSPDCGGDWSWKEWRSREPPF